MNSVKNSRSDIWNEEGDVLPLQSHGDIYFASCDLRPEKLLIWGKRPQSARSVLSARVSRKMQSSGCKRCPHCPGGVRTYSVVHNNTWLHTLGRTQLHTVWLKVSTMVAQCCTQPPAVLGVHTFGSRWCLRLNSTRLASQLFHFYCKRPQPPRPQVEGWQTVLKLGRPTPHIFNQSTIGCAICRKTELRTF